MMNHALSEARRALDIHRQSPAAEADEVLRRSLQQRRHLQKKDQMRIASDQMNLMGCELAQHRAHLETHHGRDAECVIYQNRFDRPESWCNYSANAHHQQHEATQVLLTILSE